MNLRFQRSDDVRHEIEDGVLRVTLDRAEKRNPLSLGVLEEIRLLFTASAANSQVSLAVLTGSGAKSFASGGDLAELAHYRSADDAFAFSQHGKAALDAMRHFPVPVVARINGLALGGGAELALACDMRFATATAQIGFIHGRLAIAPAWGGGNDLVRLVGPAKALRLMASASILHAVEACALGLFDGVSSSDEALDEEFDAFLAPMRRNAPHVMRAYKSLALAGRSSGRAQADALETEHFAKVWVDDAHWAAVERMNDAGRRAKEKAS